MNTLATRRLTAATMASAAILAGAGFTALGSIFNYPKVLQSPAAGRPQEAARARARQNARFVGDCEAAFVCFFIGVLGLRFGSGTFPPTGNSRAVSPLQHKSKK